MIQPAQIHSKTTLRVLILFTGTKIFAELFHHIPMGEPCCSMQHYSVIQLHISGKWSHVGLDRSSIFPQVWEQDQSALALGTDEAFSV